MDGTREYQAGDDVVIAINEASSVFRRFSVHNVTPEGQYRLKVTGQNYALDSTFGAFELRPYAGSEAQWHLEGRVLYADATARLAKMDAAREALEREIENDNGVASYGFLMGYRDGLRYVLALLSGV